MNIPYKFILIQIIWIYSICYSQFSGGIGTIEDPYQISSAEDLNNIRNYLTSPYIQNSNLYFIQTSDINLGVLPWNEEKGWEPIGYFIDEDNWERFESNYDGNNLKIYNLTINRPDTSCVGLFGWIWEANLSNIVLTGVNNITGNEYVGSIIGFSAGSVIENCTSIGSVSGQVEVGGMIGRATGNSIVRFCYSDCIVRADEYDAGGLIGYFAISDIHNCSASGEVYGGSYIGGFAGSCMGDAFHTNCRESNSNSRVFGVDQVGGFVGKVYQGVQLDQCYSNGVVNASGTSSGGFAGRIASTYVLNDTIKINNCYSITEIIGNIDVGGFAGVSLDSEIKNCYATGKTSSSIGSCGGFISNQVRSIINNCYWDIESTSQTVSDGGEGRNTSEMTLPYGANTYIGWDFNTVWRDDVADQNNGYPTFLWVSGIEEDYNILPETAALYQNYPNPFNPTTEIKFSLYQPQNLNLSVFNSKGELVQTIFDGKKNEGMHSVKFDASRLNSGIYFYKLTSEDKTETKKMLLLR